MAVFAVDSDAVLTTTAAARATIDRLHSESASLTAQLSQLQSSWTGTAATAFQGVVDQWRATQHHVEDTIGTVNQALALAGQQYADAELSNAAMFR
ncbi:WXG100 family type VII secretion target [Microbacterium endophyticum]|uniref:ESAT-6-like protein n=1 Tax=Microbacterium endophyticum TaxID=1526412 RepID=A0A7W4V1A3_9MICO|nr:WXG100 family type VII secretion target [Microbacterium endophyticum]MBB2975015.1 WXG100 family type VII secretion target [Microbacterium endophyticum]NIK37445.1 WXG100 family type VII secretion target [Microbacterium endophyticum]